MNIGTGLTSTTTTTSNTNGLLGTGPAYATFNGRWATNVSGTLQGLVGSTDTYTSGTNTEVNLGASLNGITTNSIRFGNSATVQFGGTNTIQSGGILVPSAITGTITGGTLTTPGGTGEFLLHVYGALIINSELSSTAGLTKTGSGTLTLGNIGGGVSGAINIQRGGLQVNNTKAILNASALNFTDSATHIDGAQSFIAELGDNAQGTISTPIRFSAAVAAGASNIFPNVLSTGFSNNAVVTLSGVISSAPGTVTPIRINGASNESSTLILTGNNTFTGPIQVTNGTLEFSNPAALGNASNVIQLNSNSITGGGLLLDGNNSDLTHPIVVQTSSLITTQYPTEKHTISGSLTGTQELHKRGPGTLILTGVNTLSGSIFVDAGTLQLNAASIGTSTYYHIANGTTLAFSQTGTVNTFIDLGSGTGVGDGTVNVAAGATVTANNGFYDTTFSVSSTLIKTGAGTLNIPLSGGYSGGTIVKGGTLQATEFSLGALGTPVTVEAGATLSFAGFTSRTFNLNGGSIANPANSGIVLSNATVNGGYLTGQGTYYTDDSATTTFSGCTTFPSTNLNVQGTDSFTNFTNGGLFTQTSTTNLVTLTRFTNNSSGKLVIDGPVSVTDFVSNGNLTIAQNSSTGVLTSTGGTMTLGAGSTTFIGTQGGARSGRIELSGGTLEIRGGLLVNAGPTTAVGGVTGGTTLVNYGGIAKGDGYYSNIISINGGIISGGFSPGRLNAGTFNINGSGGTYAFEIADAGPSLTFPNAPGTPGSAVGWDTVAAASRIRFSASPADRYTILLTTLVPSQNTSGQMADFDLHRAYSWLFASNPTGSFVDANGNPVSFNPNAVSLSTAGTFLNPTSGTFSIRVTPDNTQVFIDYTPIVATSLTWSGGTGDWNNSSANWLNGVTSVAWNSASEALFAVGSGTVTLTEPVAASHGLRFNVGGYTVAGSGVNTLTLGPGGGNTVTVTNAADTATISATLTGTDGLNKSGAGKLILSGNNTFTGSTTVTGGTLDAAAGSITSSTGPMSITGGGLLIAKKIAPSSLTVGVNAAVKLTNVDTPANLTGRSSVGTWDNSGLVDVGKTGVVIGTATEATIRAQIIAARNGVPGTPWTGSTGITSSNAALNPNTRAVGYFVAGSQITVAQTVMGDATLDGTVDISDLGILAQNYSLSPTTKIWQSGDFNYDGTVDIGDLGILAQNYSQSANDTPLSAPAGASAKFAADFAAVFGGGSSVPEPTSAGLFGLAAVGLLANRQRRRIAK